jgi:hypothetical protein
MALPVIFLDFDGPLFSSRAMLLSENDVGSKKPDNLPSMIDVMAGYWKMDPCAVAMLNKIVQITNAEAVISSSWRGLCEKEDIEKLFEINGLDIQLHQDWETPNVSIQMRRGEEILAWVEDHPEVDKWVAIDDDKVIGQFNPKHKVLVSSFDGILYKDYKHMLKVLT